VAAEINIVLDRKSSLAVFAEDVPEKVVNKHKPAVLVLDHPLAEVVVGIVAAAVSRSGKIAVKVGAIFLQSNFPSIDHRFLCRGLTLNLKTKQHSIQLLL